jgi:probable selenium-dependent hydroxylase accessory protein YqeC
VLPARAELVVGVVGLACLGRPMDPGTVHRPERFSAITGCAPGAPIGWEHLTALARHPQGLFKGAAGPRVLLLNQADRGAPPPRLEGLDGLPILLGCLEPVEQVKVFQRGGQA